MAVRLKKVVGRVDRRHISGGIVHTTRGVRKEVLRGTSKEESPVPTQDSRGILREARLHPLVWSLMLAKGTLTGHPWGRKVLSLFSSKRGLI